MSYKISVIVPVYNTEKYITKCLCSLLEQSFNDYEIIIVNDASPDNCTNIVNSLLLKYPHKKEIVTIYTHEYNRGIATTRNTGLEHAQGEYLIYIDSDDYVESDMLEKMYNKANIEKADIVVADYFDTFENKERYVYQRIPPSKEECIKWLLTGQLHGSNSNKLVRHKLYTDNKLRYCSDLDMYEDLIMSIELFYYSTKIKYVNKAFLHYVQYNSNSYTKKITQKSISDIVNACKVIERFLSEKHIINKHKETWMYFLIKNKVKILLNTDKQQYKTYLDLFPETNNFILKCPLIPFYYKMGLWCSIHHFQLILNFLLSLKKIKKKYGFCNNVG